MISSRRGLVSVLRLACAVILFGARVEIALADWPDAGPPTGDLDAGTHLPNSAVGEGSGVGSGIDTTGCLQTCYPYASPVSYCNFDCPGTANYIVFGEIWTSEPGSEDYSRAGIGVCHFASDGSYSKGIFESYAVASSDVVDYRVRADATSSSGLNDLVRLADPDGFEVCRVSDETHGGVKITGVLAAGDTFLFWGDGGNDKLFLCSYAYYPATYSVCTYQDPPSGDCISNEGRADGREGSDWLYGSERTSGFEYLWGGAGDDGLCGYGGSDVLRGGPDDDNLWGYAGDDWLEGGTQDDGLFGDYGSDTDDDYLYGDDYGGSNSGTADWCQCGPSAGGSYCRDANCENGYACRTSCP